MGEARPAGFGRFYLLLDRTRWLTVDSIDFLLLERWCALPPSTLFIWAGQAMAIGQLLAWIERWCEALAYVGIAKGAVVALSPAESPMAMALWLALFRRQAIIAPLVLNTRCPWSQHSMPPTFSANDWSVSVEWMIEWQADDTARFVRCCYTAARRAIQHLRALGHPGLLYHAAPDQRTIHSIDLIDCWMPSEFRHLLQASQSCFSSVTPAVPPNWIAEVVPVSHPHWLNLLPFFHEGRPTYL